MMACFPESQRDSVIQPRVGEPASLPWVRRFIFPQPQRGCIHPAPKRCNPVGVDDVFNPRSQGSRVAPTLGWMTQPRWGKAKDSPK